MIRLALVLLLLPATCFSETKPDSLSQLALDFWTWRAQYRPFSGDDVPRMERPEGQRAWSAASIAKQRSDLASFERRWTAMHAGNWPVPQQVDYRLMGSAIARVRWELDINPRWQRDPTFYVEQTVSALAEELLASPPFNDARSREIVIRAENVPGILDQARTNLKPIRAFARLAIDSLSDINDRFDKVERTLSPSLAGDDQRTRFHVGMSNASKALVAYREWLKQTLPSMRQEFALGRDAYGFFLHHAALLPYNPEQLLAMARQDFDRVLSMEAYERQRNLGAPELTMPGSTNDEIERMTRSEVGVRKYLVEHEIISVPPDVPHWTMRAAPDYLLALDGFLELDDFTGPSRLRENGVRWILPPAADLPYFAKAYAEDPRTTGVHEGMPGHYFQLSLAWRNPDPIRRQYYDSSANEGIGFYVEEMLLNAGLYDDSPRSREIIYSFARLRALRVEVDVKLALGEFTISKAADYLARTVPMDRATAESEAASFATAPGLAIAYEIGKLQIESMLAEQRLQLREKFSLRKFHDYVWSNGNVPLALQRWELVGLDDDIKKVDELAK